jgi:hypothetical protein
LQHPDAGAEPVYQLEIIGTAADECLSCVHMRGDQAGDDDMLRKRVFGLIWVLGCEGCGLANVCDEVVVHEDGAIEDDVSGWIDGYDGGVGV